MWWPSLVLGRHVVTIPSLRTIPRATKLGKNNYLKKVLNWAKKVRIWKSDLVGWWQGSLFLPSLRAPLRTIPKAPKLCKRIQLKKMLNWAKKGANLEASLVLGQLMMLRLGMRSIWAKHFRRSTWPWNSSFQIKFGYWWFLLPSNINVWIKSLVRKISVPGSWLYRFKSKEPTSFRHNAFFK